MRFFCFHLLLEAKQLNGYRRDKINPPLKNCKGCPYQLVDKMIFKAQVIIVSVFKSHK